MNARIWMAMIAGCSVGASSAQPLALFDAGIIVGVPALNGALVPALADPVIAPVIAPALAFGPLSAAARDQSLRVTLVSSRSATANPRTVHALVERSGEMVRWVELPLSELPEAVFVTGRDRFICVVTNAAGETTLQAFSGEGARVSTASLNDMLPMDAVRGDGEVSLAALDSGPCLTVPLACGSLAIVEMADDSVAAREGSFHVCSVVLSEKLSCSVDVWLSQARQLVRDGDLDAAQFALEAAVEAHPNDARGYRELAQFFRRQDRVEDQLACLQSGVDRLHQAAEGVVDTDWQVGTPAARLAVDFVLATRSVRGDEDAYVALGQTMLMYPCMEQVVLLRAEIQLESGDHEGALETLRSALSTLDPNADLAAAYHDVGRFLAKGDRPADAILFLEDSFALGNDSEFLLRGLSDLSVEMGMHDRAAAWLGHLADQWRTLENGDSEEGRSKRAEERLRALEDEITTILTAAPAPGQ